MNNSNRSDSITINVKRIKNKYDINLNIILEITPFSTIYHGYKLNSDTQYINEFNDINNINIIIEVIPLIHLIKPNILVHDNIISPIDIIYDNNNIYLIYENYKLYDKLNITNCNDFYIFFNQFRNLIVYLVDNNIEIEPIKIEDIYFIKSKNIKVIVKQFRKNKYTKYGSPIYSPPEIFINHQILLKNQLMWNFGIILYDIIKGVSPYNLCKDIKDIIEIKQIELDMSKSNDIFLKQFLESNMSNRITYEKFLNMDYTKFNIEFNINKDNNKDNKDNNKDNNNNMNENLDTNDLFTMDL
jgi:hypothetical protein